MLAIVALTMAVLFFILLKSGVLDELPETLGRPDRRKPHRWALRGSSKPTDREQNRRLEVFKDFLEDHSDGDDAS